MGHDRSQNQSIQEGKKILDTVSERAILHFERLTTGCKSTEPRKVMFLCNQMQVLSSTEMTLCVRTERTDKNCVSV